MFNVVHISMKKSYISIILSSCVVVLSFLVIVPTTSALSFFPTTTSDSTGLLNNKALETISLGNVAPTVVALNLINTALSLLAALCVAMLLYGGFLWIWARGNSETVDQAKQILQGTVIGLVIILSALGVTRFAFINIGNITGATVQNSATDED